MAKVLLQNISGAKHIIGTGKGKEPVEFKPKEQKMVDDSVAKIAMKIHSPAFQMMASPAVEESTKAVAQEKNK